MAVTNNDENAAYVEKLKTFNIAIREIILAKIFYITI